LSAGAHKEKYLDYYKAKEVPRGFQYNSGENTEWIDENQLRELIVKYVDPNFKPVL